MPIIKLNVKPTRFDLLKLEKQLDLSKRAHHLLEEKQRLLRREFLNTQIQISQAETALNSKSLLAYKALKKAILTNGVQNLLIAGSDTLPNDETDIEWSMIKGVSIPKIRSHIKIRNPLDRGYSILGTDTSIDNAGTELEELLMIFIPVAELQGKLTALDDEILKTRVRVAALEQILIPSLKHEIHKIQNALDDLERQHVVTTKWIQENQEAVSNVKSY